MTFRGIIKFLKRGFTYKTSLSADRTKTSVLQSKKPTAATSLCIDSRNKFSTDETNNGIGIIKYEEIKQMHKYPEKLLVDVREPKEIQKTGQIPNSINIPLSTLKQELAADSDQKDFRSKYGREKPQFDTEIIFYCQIGKRSQTAAQTARELGYVNTKNYLGSWSEWADKENLPK